MNFLNPKEVQDFLDNLGEDDIFQVIFQKKDGEVRELMATLPQDEKRSDNIAVLDLEGEYKRFNINRVISIESLANLEPAKFVLRG
jgi:hypothetical protein